MLLVAGKLAKLFDNLDHDVHGKTSESRALEDRIGLYESCEGLAYAFACEQGWSVAMLEDHQQQLSRQLHLGNQAGECCWRDQSRFDPHSNGTYLLFDHGPTTRLCALFASFDESVAIVYDKNDVKRRDAGPTHLMPSSPLPSMLYWHNIKRAFPATDNLHGSFCAQFHSRENTENLLLLVASSTGANCRDDSLVASRLPPRGGSFHHASSVVATHTIKYVIVVLEQIHIPPIEDRFQLAEIEIHHLLHFKVVGRVRIRIDVHGRSRY